MHVKVVGGGSERHQQLRFSGRKRLGQNRHVERASRSQHRRRKGLVAGDGRHLGIGAQEGCHRIPQRLFPFTFDIRLQRGSIRLAGVSSPHSLYNNDLASFVTGSYNHKDAEGFIKLFGLPMAVEKRFRKKK